MSNSGTPFQTEVRLALGKRAPHTRLFRNNRGLFWAGKVVNKTASTVTLAQPRMVECGLVNGSSDLIGWTVITVTPDMVGRQVAVFTAEECKSGSGRPSEDQLRFIANVQEAGGIAGVVRTVEDAIALVTA
jgi:hypothetical protein